VSLDFDLELHVFEMGKRKNTESAFGEKVHLETKLKIRFMFFI